LALRETRWLSPAAAAVLTAVPMMVATPGRSATRVAPAAARTPLAASAGAPLESAEPAPFQRTRQVLVGAAV